MSWVGLPAALPFSQQTYILSKKVHVNYVSTGIYRQVQLALVLIELSLLHSSFLESRDCNLLVLTKTIFVYPCLNKIQSRIYFGEWSYLMVQIAVRLVFLFDQLEHLALSQLLVVVGGAGSPDKLSCVG